MPLPVNDGFEGNPHDRWTVSEVPGLTNVFLGEDRVNALNGSNLAFLNAYPDAPATATIFRTITPDTVTSSIQGRLWMRRWAHPGETEDTVIVFLRIRAGGPTGRIISVNNTALEDADSWFLRTFNLFRPAGTFTIEISAYRGTVLVDDLNFRFV
ncbi:hypothetical protein ACTMTJ_08385 [Phytohabitans sp. LJ34]|uniref:hypothetical protein n=1 Tax=Phytohabitans sp. LJ34 TaxID=3452217 RepID=UPI003F89533D